MYPELAVADQLTNRNDIANTYQGIAHRAIMLL
jgi:hypothetical protein